MSSIYVHFPFCKRKCLYCGFYSVANLQLKPAFLDAICTEIELTQHFFAEKKLRTLYFGGGTPSLFSSKELERVILQIHKFYDVSNDLEFTMEANPEQLTVDYLHELKSLGINRLSIGVQSFDDQILQLLRRRHSAEMAKKAVENAAASGFDNLSIDLIYDIAFRTKEMWRHDLQTALRLPIRHLSAYSLTVEENTLLAKQVSDGKPFIPNDTDTERDYALLVEMTQKAGFEQYEISNFAKNGAVSQHNSAYWTGEPYLGLGPAAHSFRSPVRSWNIDNIKLYINAMQKREPLVEQEILTPEMRYDEYVLLRLRTKKGIDFQEVENQFGISRLQYLQNQLKKVNPAHYELNGSRMTLTYQGRLFADAVAAELFSDN